MKKDDRKKYINKLVFIFGDNAFGEFLIILRYFDHHFFYIMFICV